MMKQLLIIIAFLSIAVTLMATKYPLHQTQLSSYTAIPFQSTSAITGSGSHLPQAAVTGVTTTYDQALSVQPEVTSAIRARPNDWTDPYPNPVGDISWGLIAMLVGIYVLVHCKKIRHSS